MHTSTWKVITFILFFIVVAGRSSEAANNYSPEFTDPYGINGDDTVFKNRNGREIKRIKHEKIDIAYIVKTVRSTEEIYGVAPHEMDHGDRGRSCPITNEEAHYTESLIRSGQIVKALETGNLVELYPLADRQADARHLKKDNGRGGETEANNKEYATAVATNGHREEYTGELSDPSRGEAGVSMIIDTNTLQHSHSHPSGTIERRDAWTTSIRESKFYPQAPGRRDISLVPAGRIRVVFARATDKVYLYDHTGVIAVMKTKRYLQ